MTDGISNSGNSRKSGNGAPSNGSAAESRSGSGPVTVLLILDDGNDRHSTRSALDSLPGVEVVGERSELRSGLLLARQLRPRVVLLDLPDAYEEALSAAGSFKLDSPDVALLL